MCTLQLNTDGVLRSNRMKQAGHIAVVGGNNKWTANLKERNHFDLKPVDCMIILKCCRLYNTASRYRRPSLFVLFGQWNRGFEPHSGHLKVYLFATGCVLSCVGTHFETVRVILANT